jgi:hypothetical protein
MVKRDNAYFERRLEKDHPQLYADVKAGRITVTEARRRAGMGKPRTRLQEMVNAWEKASPDERDDFLDHLCKKGVPIGGATTAPNTPRLMRASADATVGSGLSYQVAIDGTLTPQAKTRILEIINRRKLFGSDGSPKYGVIMQELVPAFKSRNMALAQAVRRGNRLSPDMVRALEQWLISQKHV